MEHIFRPWDVAIVGCIRDGQINVHEVINLLFGEHFFRLAQKEEIADEAEVIKVTVLIGGMLSASNYDFVVGKIRWSERKKRLCFTPLMDLSQIDWELKSNDCFEEYISPTQKYVARAVMHNIHFFVVPIQKGRD
jgi:hypothetical protein